VRGGGIKADPRLGVQMKKINIIKGKQETKVIFDSISFKDISLWSVSWKKSEYMQVVDESFVETSDSERAPANED
jgi:hypothetical protein